MLYGLAIVLIPLFLGYLFKVGKGKLQVVNQVVNICLYLILFVMGISLGQLDDIGSKLPQIGGIALGLSLIIQFSNIIGLAIYDKWQPMVREEVNPQEIPSRWVMLMDSFKLIGTTIAGGVIGFVSKGTLDFPLHASTYVLEVMIFGVGIQLRNSGIPLREVFLTNEAFILL
ncbi:Membrane protein of uncharacterised function (DUF340) [Actinobacillus equuli]|nr:Membrane protein of uncharacterised function (DUF340) [Actinobacillus equuli]